MNRFFQYIDPTDYEITNEGLMKACTAEIIAEAEDSGDYPMYSAEDILRAANYLYLTILNDVSLLMEAHLDR